MPRPVNEIETDLQNAQSRVVALWFSTEAEPGATDADLREAQLNVITLASELRAARHEQVERGASGGEYRYSYWARPNDESTPWTYHTHTIPASQFYLGLSPTETPASRLIQEAQDRVRAALGGAAQTTSQWNSLYVSPASREMTARELADELSSAPKKPKNVAKQSAIVANNLLHMGFELCGLRSKTDGSVEIKPETLWELSGVLDEHTDRTMANFGFRLVSENHDVVARVKYYGYKHRDLNINVKVRHEVRT